MHEKNKHRVLEYTEDHRYVSPPYVNYSDVGRCTKINGKIISRNDNHGSYKLSTVGFTPGATPSKLFSRPPGSSYSATPPVWGQRAVDQRHACMQACWQAINQIEEGDPSNLSSRSAKKKKSHGWHTIELFTAGILTNSVET